MRRPRLRHLHDRVLDEDALARQPVERGRRSRRVAVGADAIGAQRVDGHQQQVCGGRGRSGGRGEGDSQQHSWRPFDHSSGRPGQPRPSRFSARAEVPDAAARHRRARSGRPAASNPAARRSHACGRRGPTRSACSSIAIARGALPLEDARVAREREGPGVRGGGREHPVCRLARRRRTAELRVRLGELEPGLDVPAAGRGLERRRSPRRRAPGRGAARLARRPPGRREARAPALRRPACPPPRARRRRGRRASARAPRARRGRRPSRCPPRRAAARARPRAAARASAAGRRAAPARRLARARARGSARRRLRPAPARRLRRRGRPCTSCANGLPRSSRASATASPRAAPSAPPRRPAEGAQPLEGRHAVARVGQAGVVERTLAAAARHVAEGAQLLGLVGRERRRESTVAGGSHRGDERDGGRPASRSHEPAREAERSERSPGSFARSKSSSRPPATSFDSPSVKQRSAAQRQLSRP